MHPKKWKLAAASLCAAAVLAQPSLRADQETEGETKKQTPSRATRQEGSEHVGNPNPGDAYKQRSSTEQHRRALGQEHEAGQRNDRAGAAFQNDRSRGSGEYEGRNNRDARADGLTREERVQNRNSLFAESEMEQGFVSAKGGARDLIERENAPGLLDKGAGRRAVRDRNDDDDADRQMRDRNRERNPEATQWMNDGRRNVRGPDRDDRGMNRPDNRRYGRGQFDRNRPSVQRYGEEGYNRQFQYGPDQMQRNPAMQELMMRDRQEQEELSRAQMERRRRMMEANQERMRQGAAEDGRYNFQPLGRGDQVDRNRRDANRDYFHYEDGPAGRSEGRDNDRNMDRQRLENRNQEAQRDREEAERREMRERQEQERERARDRERERNQKENRN